MASSQSLKHFRGWTICSLSVLYPCDKDFVPSVQHKPPVTQLQALSPDTTGKSSW